VKKAVFDVVCYGDAAILRLILFLPSICSMSALQGLKFVRISGVGGLPETSRLPREEGVCKMCRILKFVASSFVLDFIILTRQYSESVL
jgi:hypothetical protein